MSFFILWLIKRLAVENKRENTILFLKRKINMCNSDVSSDLPVV